MDRPPGPRPWLKAVFTLSIRFTAGIPSSRRNAPLWQASHETWSCRRLHTAAGIRLCDSVIQNRCSGSGPAPTSTLGYSVQSVCACAPGVVSTRREVRSFGLVKWARMWRNTER